MALTETDVEELEDALSPSMEVEYVEGGYDDYLRVDMNGHHMTVNDLKVGDLRMALERGYAISYVDTSVDVVHFNKVTAETEVVEVERDVMTFTDVNE